MSPLSTSTAGWATRTPAACSCPTKPWKSCSPRPSGRSSLTHGMAWSGSKVARSAACQCAIALYTGRDPRSVGDVLIDLRRSVPLGVPEKRATLVVPTPKPPPGTAFPPRRLTLRGVSIFELNLWCGTCPALFRKLAEPEAADLGLANELLSEGLGRIRDEVLRAYGNVLPKSTYTVLLLETTPNLVTPPSQSDYFSHEQAATWGVDPAVGSPEYLGTPYYRTFEAPVGQNGY